MLEPIDRSIVATVSWWLCFKYCCCIAIPVKRWASLSHPVSLFDPQEGSSKANGKFPSFDSSDCVLRSPPLLCLIRTYDKIISGPAFFLEDEIVDEVVSRTADLPRPSLSLFTDVCLWHDSRPRPLT